MVIALYLFALVMGLFFSSVQGQPIHKDNPQQEISVSGMGRKAVLVDLATVRVSILHQGKVASEAQHMTSTANENLLKVIREEEPKDLHTTAIWVNPVYNYTDGVSRLWGYESGTSLSFDMPVDKVGGVIDKTVRFEGTRIDSVNGKLSEGLRKETLPQVIGSAVEDSRVKGNIIAEALGVCLGKPLRASLTDTTTPIYVPTRSFATFEGGEAAMSSPTMTYVPEEQEVSATVDVTYAHGPC